MRDEQMKKEVPVMAVKKALNLLEILHIGGLPDSGMHLSDIARHMDMPANSARNILKTLVVCGYVEQAADTRYLPGPSCRHMGRLNRVLSPDQSRQVQEILQHITDTVGEATVYTVLLGGNRVLVGTAEPDREVRVNQAVVVSESIFMRPTGRILAAYASQAELDRILIKHGLPGAIWNGIRTRSELARALSHIRETGECIEPSGEVLGMACPVFDSDQHFTGALGCHAPLFRCTAKKQKQILDELKKNAETLGNVTN